ncbi:hypothetical protein M8494_24195 [Serratia ureilytica]
MKATCPEAKNRRGAAVPPVAYDYGAKRNILRMLVIAAAARPWCRRRPGRGGAEMNPTASSCPTAWRPEPCDYAIAAIKQFLETDIPVFGICLATSCWRWIAGRKP